VLSNTVASAFSYYGDDDTKKTERFVRTFDRFFEYQLFRGRIHKMKPDLDPCREKDDDYFEVNKFCFSCNYYIVTLCSGLKSIF